jgi:hypothetical protein
MERTLAQREEAAAARRVTGTGVCGGVQQRTNRGADRASDPRFGADLATDCH